MLGAASLLSAWQSTRAQKPATRFFRIGTGGVAGTYFPVGTLIADLVNGDAGGNTGCPDQPCALSGRVAVAQLSSGSVANCTALRAGSIDTGIAQSDTLYNCWHGLASFAEAGPCPELRFVTTLYEEAVYLVVAETSNIRSIEDIRGQRIGVDEIGSGSLDLTRTMLMALGIKESDFQPQYVKPDVAAERMSAGRLDGFIAVDAVPSAVVANFLSRYKARLVPISREDAALIGHSHPAIGAITIPSIYYAGQPEVPSVRVQAQLAATSRLEDDVVHALLQLFWGDLGQARLRDNPPGGVTIRLASALAGAAIPLHDGAERFYREIGALK